MRKKRQRILALVQGIYYVATGAWPIFGMSSFIAVTGPKETLWLVITVGVLLLVTGVVLLTSAVRGWVGLEGFLLAVGDASGLAIIEIVYVFGGQIPPIYLVDAIFEIVLVVAWLLSTMISEPVVPDVAFADRTTPGTL